MTEKEIETSILNYLEFLPGCYAWKNNTTGVYDPTKKVFRKSKNRYAINGISDILGVYHGRFLAIEVKTPKNKLRPDHQVTFIDHINFRGGIAFFATSVDEVMQKLKGLKIEAQ